MTRLSTFALLVLFIGTSALAGSIGGGYTYAKPTSSGYTYDKPSVGLSGFAFSAESTGQGGHYFPSLPTIKPLPAVPSLPALPTPHSKGSVHQQALFQTHPFPTSSPYGPQPTHSHSSVGKIAQQYRPTSIPTGITSFGSFGPTAGPTAPSGLLPPTIPSSRRENTILGAIYGPTPNPPTGFIVSGEPQPLRIPFGKEAVVHYPQDIGSDQDLIGNVNGRELKQYAVVEIIDNDIVQKSEPFLSAPVRNEYRAQFGATGTGATPSGGIQLASRAAINVLQQQQRLTASNPNDNIALGSGGLGFIRLANGNVYLGSGSLGYISGQQLSQNLNEARTRSEQAQPDALHFGHGSLGGGTTSSFNRIFKFR